MSDQKEPAILTTGNCAVLVALLLISLVGYKLFSYRYETVCGLPAPIIRELDASHDFTRFNAKAKVPYLCSIEEYNYVIKKWSIDYYNKYREAGTWGVTPPALMNHFLGENFLLDGYHRMTALEPIRAEKTEFYRMQFDICAGLPSEADLSEFGVLDRALPAQKKLSLKKADVKTGTSASLGDYEEAESVYLTTSGLEFYAKQRVYVIGRTRYVITFATKNSMLHRVAHLRDEFMENGLEVDMAAALAPEPLTDGELLEQADALLREAAALRQESGGQPDNAAYRALLRCCAAINLYERMASPPPIRENALFWANQLRGLLQAELERLRGEAISKRDPSEPQEFDKRLATIRAILDSEGDATAPAQRDEWLEWADEAEITLKEEGLVSSRHRFASKRKP